MNVNLNFLNSVSNYRIKTFLPDLIVKIYHINHPFQLRMQYKNYCQFYNESSIHVQIQCNNLITKIFSVLQQILLQYTLLALIVFKFIKMYILNTIGFKNIFQIFSKMNFFLLSILKKNLRIILNKRCYKILDQIQIQIKLIKTLRIYYFLQKLFSLFYFNYVIIVLHLRYNEAFKCGFKFQENQDYQQFIVNAILSDGILGNIFNESEDYQQEFNQYIMQILKNRNNLVELLQKVNNEFETNNIITLKRIEVFTLILMMYFNLIDKQFKCGNFYIINMEELKVANVEVTQEKLRCITNYIKLFFSNREQIELEQIQYVKNSINEQQYLNRSSILKSNQPINFRFTRQKNEDQRQSTVVDFANENIGGQALHYKSCTQEDILMLLYPEAIISMLFVQPMKANEAVLIQNLIKYNNYTGYESTFKQKNLEQFRWEEKYNLLAIDAEEFFDDDDQFSQQNINRELIKCYCGFEISLMREPNYAISTGKWGCGIFKGNPYLKTIIQLICYGQACDAAKDRTNEIIFNVSSDVELYNFGQELLKRKEFVTLNSLEVTLKRITNAKFNSNEDLRKRILNELQKKQSSVRYPLRNALLGCVLISFAGVLWNWQMQLMARSNV
ncbi:unnamed protein product (macronuclear) [Paramecium tetraurelia]|uniref:PARG catalytic Macro domain-containing protein n=1 Tax=Paramecium tetraurelia TaxID=5888 RepID=A0DTI4_PARTE|nr:uncharacterized protein GSPATT00020032001 [Paramecium tetraurelia]CAK86351.1 unnamed protein product [Paramecium tetraurelia]|eukprot:XP_001453748.1 hypothetical protein (macronuclear) [Paramecium tetraurelia strain d4-2]